MIQSPKRDQYLSFWCQWGQNHLRAFEVIDAIEVSEAAQVNEATHSRVPNRRRF